MSAKVKWALNAVKLSYYIFLVHPSSSMTISQFFLFLHTSNNCFFHLTHNWWLLLSMGKENFIPSHKCIYPLLSIGACMLYFPFWMNSPHFCLRKPSVCILNLIPFLNTWRHSLSSILTVFILQKFGKSSFVACIFCMLRSWDPEKHYLGSTWGFRSYLGSPWMTHRKKGGDTSISFWVT